MNDVELSEREVASAEPRRDDRGISPSDVETA